MISPFLFQHQLIKQLYKALSYQTNVDLEKTFKARRILEAVSTPLSPLYKLWDRRIERDGHEVRIRLYTPPDKTERGLLLFFHGGGWVHETVDTYNNVCRGLARATGRCVASVEYSRAPEHVFPVALEDCYAAARAIYERPEEFGAESGEITLIGDSAGATLAAGTSLMARDKGEFEVTCQILLYPATWYDHSPESPFPSVRENGEDYLLTSKLVEEYMTWYAGGEPELCKSPYFAPLNCKNFSHQPRTLVITAEYDPLRDEGEAYALRLREAGNDAGYVRMPGMLHGYFSLGAIYPPVRRTHELIIDFLNGNLFCGDGRIWEKETENET